MGEVCAEQEYKDMLPQAIYIHALLLLDTALTPSLLLVHMIANEAYLCKWPWSSSERRRSSTSKDLGVYAMDVICYKTRAGKRMRWKIWNQLYSDTLWQRDLSYLAG